MTEIQIGEVLSETIRLAVRSALRLILLTVIIAVPCLGVMAITVIGTVGTLDFETGAPGEAWLIAISYLVGGLAATYFNAVVICEAHQRLIRRPLSIWAVLIDGLRSFPRLLALMILLVLLYFASFIPLGFGAGLYSVAGNESGVGMAIGMILFFVVWTVGGTILYCVWFVLLPVSVLEKRIVSSFGRSAFLTKRNRFQILAVLLVFGLGATAVYMAIVFAVVLATSILEPGSTGGSALQTASIVVGALIYLVVIAILTAIQAMLPTVIYHRLRRIKEGGEAEQLFEVFD